MPMPMVKKQFGGDTGTDADYQDGGEWEEETGIDYNYYDENNEQYIRSNKMVIPNTDYRIKPIKEDLLKLMDKVDSVEQMIHNLNAKTREQYMLINDRVDEAFDIIKILEKDK